MRGNSLRNNWQQSSARRQPEISKIEHRTDMYVSTLPRFVEAMGGKLEITAQFPDGTVRITQFHELDTGKQ